MMTSTPHLLSLLALAACILCMSWRAEAWDPMLAKDDVESLDVFPRDQWQKAQTAYKKRNYTLARSEFETFATAYPDVPATVAAIFMQAHCTFMDGKRYEAIKQYRAVTDAHADNLTYAPAAMYYIGRAYMDSGDDRKGLKTFESLVATPAYSAHPLVAEALGELAENYRKNDDWPRYFRYATRIHTDYWTTNRRAADNMRHELTRYYVKGHRYAEIEALHAIHVYEAPTTQADYYLYVWDRAYFDVLHSKTYYTQKEEPERQADIDAFWAYWLSGREVIETASQWDWDWRSLNFLMRYRMDKTDLWQPVLDRIITDDSTDDQIRAVIGLLTNHGLHDDARALIPRITDQQGFFVLYAGELLTKNALDEAETIIAQVDDKETRKWLTYDHLRRKNDWPAAITLLQDIIATDPERALPAQWALADIYLNRTRQYEEATAVYIAIDQPPNSLFHLAIAYERWGKHQKAADTYWEIEKNHPDSGAEAAYRCGRMWERFGDKEKAITIYRRILKEYKGTSQASHVHEGGSDSRGIATGGGELTP